jgi:hypothetical protein
MAAAGGVFACSYGARDSGASGYFYASSTRLVGAVDDSIFLSRWTARIPCMDDARIVARVCDRLGALPCIDSTAVEHLNTGRNPTLGWGFKLPIGHFRICWLPAKGFPSLVHVHDGFRSENRCAETDRFDCG